MPKKENLVPIRIAAQRTKHSRTTIRQLIEDRRVKAFRRGGRSDRPTLLVDPADVTAAIEAGVTEYIPPKPRKRNSQRAIRELHPAAAAMGRRNN